MFHTDRNDKLFLGLMFLAVIVVCVIIGRGMYIHDVGGFRERTYYTVRLGIPASISVKQVKQPGLRTSGTYTIVEAEFKGSKNIIFYIDELQEANRFYRPVYLIQGDKPRSCFKVCFDNNECYEAKYSKLNATT